MGPEFYWIIILACAAYYGAHALYNWNANRNPTPYQVMMKRVGKKMAGNVDRQLRAINDPSYMDDVKLEVMIEMEEDGLDISGLI